MSYTREDKVYFDGYFDGYKKAVEDIRQELLTLEADTNAPVSIEIYEILNFLKRKVKENKS